MQTITNSAEGDKVNFDGLFISGSKIVQCKVQFFLGVERQRWRQEMVGMYGNAYFSDAQALVHRNLHVPLAYGYSHSGSWFSLGQE